MGITIGGADGVAVGIGDADVVVEGVMLGATLGVRVGVAVGEADAVRVGVGVGVGDAETPGDVEGAGVSAACAGREANKTEPDAITVNANVRVFIFRRWGSIRPSSPIHT